MRRKLYASVAGAILIASQAQAGTLYIAQMDGVHEPTPTGEPYVGTGFVILNDAGTSATVTATHNIPTAQLTAGHIHRGPTGVAGPVIFGFTPPTSPVGPLVWAIPAADVVNLQNGGLYMQFHTTAHPGGAIRNQLTRVTFDAAAPNTYLAAVATMLDNSAGYDASLDTALKTMATSSVATQTAELSDLSGSSLYVQSREGLEAMNNFGAIMLTQGDQGRMSGMQAKEGFGVFASAGYNTGMRDAVAGESGARISRPYVIGGVDYTMAGGFHVGIGVGYADGKETLKFGLGQTKGKTTAVEGFASTDFNGAMIAADATVGVGWTSFDMIRNLPSFSATATGHADATSWNGALRISAPFPLEGGYKIAPFVLIDHESIDIDAYNESGASGLGLMVPKQSVKNTNAEAGVSLGGSIAEDWGTLMPRAQIGWYHPVDNGKTTLATHLIGSPNIAFNTALLATKDAAHVELGVGARTASGVDFSVGYRGYIGSSRLNIHGIEGRVRFQF